MAYIKKKTVAGNSIRIEKYYSSRYGSKGKCTRSQNFEKTPEKMAIRNARYACIKADDVFNANFKEGDLMLTFTFSPNKRPSNPNEVLKIWNNYIRRVRYAYKKAGVVFKWQKGIETPEKNPHIHAAFTYIDLALLPKWEYGSVKIERFDDRDHHTYGGYMRELTHIKAGNAGKYNQAKSTQFYSHSRNCVIPQPEVTVITSDHWADEPKAPKGYYVVKESVQNWEDEVNGYKHQSYVLCKIPDKNKKPCSRHRRKE